MPSGFYELPKLRYAYADLQPFMSEAQLTVHHSKHHQAYVTGANALLQKIDASRKDGSELDMKSVLKSLSFNIGGHVLHSRFWGNLAPPGNGGGGTPGGKLADAVKKEFGSFERFKKEFGQAASSVEGSGWAVLAYCGKLGRPVIMQVEKHNTNLYPMFSILMAVDVFEHAYYIDYKNDRAAFIENCWNLINWDAVGKRLEQALG